MGPQKMLSYAVVVTICKYDLPSENGCSWLPCFMSMRGISHSSAQMAGLQVKGLRCLQLLFDTEPDPIFFLGANMRPMRPRSQPCKLGDQRLEMERHCFFKNTRLTPMSVSQIAGFLPGQKED